MIYLEKIFLIYGYPNRIEWGHPGIDDSQDWNTVCILTWADDVSQLCNNNTEQTFSIWKFYDIVDK